MASEYDGNTEKEVTNCLGKPGNAAEVRVGGKKQLMLTIQGVWMWAGWDRTSAWETISLTHFLDVLQL